MATSFGALCTDFYINQKLSLKMELPAQRETILHFFDSVRKVNPSMKKFNRFRSEFALDSSRSEDESKWLALGSRSLRTGHVNPDSIDAAKKFHQFILEIAPYHLTISALDVDYLELVFGFDLECEGNQDEVICRALFEESPMNSLLDIESAKVLDAQPSFGVTLNESGNLQAFFEVCTRSKTRRGSSKANKDEPISILLSVRKYGAIEKIDDLLEISNTLFEHCDQLASDKLVPNLLTPISRRITSGLA